MAKAIKRSAVKAKPSAARPVVKASVKSSKPVVKAAVKSTKPAPIAGKKIKTSPTQMKLERKKVAAPVAVKPEPKTRPHTAPPTTKPIPPKEIAAATKVKKSSAPLPVPSKKLGPPQPPVIIPSPIPTDGKPRKNQAGLTSRELENYRELLLAKRRELVGDMSSMEREALRSAGSNLSNLPMHMADQGTDNYEQEFTLGLVEKDRQLLREINRALGKIQDGTYGICEGTGKPISKPRLEAQPWAKYSIEYARELEKGGVRR